MVKKRSFTTVIQKIADDKKLLESFLDDILTPKEYEELEKRWEIVERLNKGETQRSIADDVDVGIATVTRGSREMNDPKGGFQKVLKKLGEK